LIPSAMDPFFVQPLRDNVLIAESRHHGGVDAEIWSSEGDLLRSGDIADAVEEFLTTPTGAIRAGYVDEESSQAGPGSQGLVRYDADCGVDWVYPFGVDSDCPRSSTAVPSTSTARQHTAARMTSSISSRPPENRSSTAGQHQRRVSTRSSLRVTRSPSTADTPLTTTWSRFSTSPAATTSPARRRRLVVASGLEVQNGRMPCRGRTPRHHGSRPVPRRTP